MAKNLLDIKKVETYISIGMTKFQALAKEAGAMYGTRWNGFSQLRSI